MKKLDDSRETNLGIKIFNGFVHFMVIISILIVIYSTLIEPSVIVVLLFSGIGLYFTNKVRSISILKRRAQERGMTLVEYINYLNNNLE